MKTSKSDIICIIIYYLLLFLMVSWIIYFGVISPSIFNNLFDLLDNNFGDWLGSLFILCWGIGFYCLIILYEGIINKIFYPLTKEEQILKDKIKYLKENSKDNRKDRLITRNKIQILRYEYKIKRNLDEIKEIK